MSDLKLDPKEVGDDTLLLVVSGPVLESNEADFEKSLDALRGGPRLRFILDLSGVEFFTNKAAGSVFGALKDARARGGFLVLLSPSKAVLRILDHLDIHRMFAIARSREEALDLLSRPPVEIPQPYVRLAKRTPASNTLVRARDENGRPIFLIAADQGEDGLGCLYAGNHPPNPGERLAWSGGGRKRGLQVRWVRAIEENVYRLGLQFFRRKGSDGAVLLGRLGLAVAGLLLLAAVPFLLLVKGKEGAAKEGERPAATEAAISDASARSAKLLAAGPRLVGLLVDESRTALTGVAVALEGAGVPPEKSQTVLSDAMGGFSLVVPALGRITLRAGGGSWLEKRVEVQLPHAEPVRITLQRGREVGARVRDLRGKPIAGAVLSYSYGDERNSFARDGGAHSAESGASGEVRLNLPPEGPFQLRVAHPDFVAQEFRDLTAQSKLDFVLERGGRVQGRILDAKNGKAVAGARVEIRSSQQDKPSLGMAETSTASDSDGRYHTPVLPVGKAVLSVVARDYLPLEPARIRIIAGTEFERDFRLDPGRSLRLRLLDHSSHAPLAQRNFRMSPALGEEWRQCDGAGECVVGGLGAEPRWFTVQAEGYARARQLWKPDRELLVFELGPEVLVHLRVEDVQGRPLRSARFRPAAGEDAGFTVEDSYDGELRLHVLSGAGEGRHRVAVMAEGYKETEVTVEGRAGEITAARVVLENAPRLRVLLKGLVDPPPAHVTARFESGAREPLLTLWPGEEAGEYQASLVDAVSGQHFRLFAKGYLPTAPEELILQGGASRHAFELRRGRILEGRVQDETGRPVATARATLRRRAATGPVGPDDTLDFTESDTTGRFTLSGFDDSAVEFLEIAVTHGDFAPYRLAFRPQAGWPAVITLGRGAEVSGWVLQPDGTPAAQARVLLVRGEDAETPKPDGESLEALSARDGAFSFALLADGAYVLSADGSAGFAAPLSLEVRDGQAHAGVKLQLRAGLAISGRIADATGKPAAGLELTVQQALPAATGSQKVAKAQSGPGGEFVFSGLAEGEYDLAPLASQKLEFAEPGARIKAGSADLLLRVRKKTVLRGRVVTPEGKPIEEVQIFSVYNFGGEETAYLEQNLARNPDGKGTFSFAPLPQPFATAKSLQILATAPGYGPGRSPSFDPSAYNGEELLITLQKGLGVEALVLEAGSPRPISGARVSVVKKTVTGGKTVVAGLSEVATHADGSARIPGLTQGEYALTCGAPGFAPKTVEVSVEENVATPVRVELGKGAVLSGVVRGAELQPLKGRIVRVLQKIASPPWYGAFGIASAATDATGAYRIAAIPPGAYTVQSVGQQEALENNTEGLELVLAEGENRTLDLGGAARAGLAVVEGLVLDPDLRVQGLELAAAAPGAVSKSYRTQPGADRRFLFEDVNPGSYRLVVTEPTLASFSIPVAVRAAERLYVEVRRPAGSLRARVASPEGEPVSRATALVYPAGALSGDNADTALGQSVARTALNQGKLEIGGLPAGRYDLAIVPQTQSHGLISSLVKNLDVQEGTLQDLGTLVLERGHKISFRAKDFRGQPIAGARAQFRDAAGAWLILSDNSRWLTDSAGMLEIPAAPAFLRARFTAAGYLPATVDAGPGEEFAVVLTHGATLRVQLKGQSSARRMLELQSAASGTAAKLPGPVACDAEGRLDISGLAPGAYRVKVLPSQPGEPEIQSADISFVSEEEKTIDIEVP